MTKPVPFSKKVAITKTQFDMYVSQQ